MPRSVSPSMTGRKNSVSRTRHSKLLLTHKWHTHKKTRQQTRRRRRRRRRKARTSPSSHRQKQ
jgi:hypothetical protein